MTVLLKRRSTFRLPLFLEVTGSILILIILIFGGRINFTSYIALFSELIESRDLSALGLDRRMTHHNYILAFISFIIIMIPFILRGIYTAFSRLKTAAYTLNKKFISSEFPPNLIDFEIIFNEIIKRKTNSQYAPLDNQFLTIFFGKKTAGIPPIEYEMVEEAGKRINWRIKGAALLLGLAGVMIWIWYIVSTPDFTPHTNMGRFLFHMKESFLYLLPLLLNFPLFMLLITDGMAFMVELISIRLLIPKKTTIAEYHREEAQLKIHGQPDQLINRLISVREKSRENQPPYRIYRTDQSISSDGTFKSLVLIEKKPACIEAPHLRAANYLFYFSWFLLIQHVIIMFLPFSVFMAASIVFPFEPLMIKVILLIGTILCLDRLLLTYSHRFLERAGTINKINHFFSFGLFIEMEGTLTTGNIAIGNAEEDSILSEGSTTYSDFTASFYGGEIYSESREMPGKRHMISIKKSTSSEFIDESIATETVKEWMEKFIEDMKNFQEEAVTPLGIDTSSPLIDSILSKNIEVSKLRKDPEPGIQQVVSNHMSLSPHLLLLLDSILRLDNNSNNNNKHMQ